ncbi:leucine-rich PPR motif-containing protein, mitochondrial-like [Lasioglossum baleicum]|uniref:leucine-rich PPR motif-containing protein, mitochondrial-like n=1 Tax=Lasioglossum baleicum TaxID=434251 RepID=UPI003FCE404C
MISLRRHNKFLRLSLAFVNVSSNLSELTAHKLFVRKCVVPTSTFNYAAKILKCNYYTHPDSISRKDAYEVKSFQYKIFKLNEKFEKREVTETHLKDMIERLENGEHDLSEGLGVMLLKCCGNIMYYVDLKTRRSLCERVWNLLKKEIVLTKDHYHALLQTYIDNGYFVDPDKFLEEMIVPPDYDTYRLLLKLLSITDTTTSVNDFLSRMRNKDFIFDEEVYSALIYSYSLLGDIKSIEEVIDSMRKENIELSDITYNQMIYALAKTGDIQNLTETLKTRDVPLSDIMKLVKFLSLEKNGEHISEVLMCIKPLTKQEEDVLASIVQLVHEQRYLDAYKIVTEIPITDEKAVSIRKVLAFHFIQEMINSNTDYKVILENVVNLAVNQKIPEVWRKAAQLAAQTSKEMLTLNLFDEMKANGIAVQSHYYWPLLLNAHKHGDESDVYSILRHMMGLNIELDFNTLLNYVMPHIDTSNPVDTVQKMSDNGIPPAFTVPPLMRFLLDSYRVQESLTLCKKFKKKVDCQLMLESLILNYKKSKDIDLCIQLLFELSFNGIGFAGTFLRKFVEQPEFGPNDVNNLIKFLTTMKQIQAVMSDLDIKHVEEKIFQLKLSDYNKETISHFLVNVSANVDTDNYNSGQSVHPKYMNMDQLRVHLQMLRSKGLNTRGCLRRLLMASCNANNVEEVNELVKEIKLNNIEFTAGMKVTLFDFYTRNEKMVDSLTELHEIQSMYPNFLIDNFKILNFVTLLVKERKIDEALDVIKECTKVNHKTKAFTQCLRLLNLLAKCSDYSYTKKMADLLVQNGYCEYNDVLLSCLLKNSLLHNNIEFTVNEFKRYAKEYKKTPAKQEILTQLIKQTLDISTEHNHLLDSVYHVLVDVHGKDAATVNVAISLVQCGQVERLKSLLENNSLSTKALLQEMKYLPEYDIIRTCGILLEIGGEILKMKLEPICNLALTVYTKQGATTSAAKLREKMIQKGVQPSLKFEEAFNELKAKYELRL